MIIKSFFFILICFVLFINCILYEGSAVNENITFPNEKRLEEIEKDLPINENITVINDRKQNDIKITKKVNEILNKIEAAILIKEGKIIKIDTFEPNDKPDFDTQFPERNEYYQGDIILTEEQAIELVNCAIKEAIRKGVDVSSINTTIGDKKVDAKLQKLLKI